MPMTIIRAAATTANLGPGFDCLGLALDLWNETRFTLINDPTKIVIQGEGKDTLPKDGNNLIALAAQKVYQKIGVPPPGLFIQCHNRIPLDSGLGSSAAATLTGLLGANALLGNPLTSNDLLELGAQIEGHADNIVPALLGGLTIAVEDKGEIISRSYPPTDFKVVILLPLRQQPYSTQQAREALPTNVPLQHAVYNIGRAALVVDALRSGDLTLLGRVMADRLHQPYRLGLIPGAQAALEAARQAGAAAALSGAGPSVVAFAHNNAEAVAEKMSAAFNLQGINTRRMILSVTHLGAQTFPEQGEFSL